MWNPKTSASQPGEKSCIGAIQHPTSSDLGSHPTWFRNGSDFLAHQTTYTTSRRPSDITRKAPQQLAATLGAWCFVAFCCNICLKAMPLASGASVARLNPTFSRCFSAIFLQHPRKCHNLQQQNGRFTSHIKQQTTYNFSQHQLKPFLFTIISHNFWTNHNQTM